MANDLQLMQERWEIRIQILHVGKAFDMLSGFVTTERLKQNIRNFYSNQFISSSTETLSAAGSRLKQIHECSVVGGRGLER